MITISTAGPPVRAGILSVLATALIACSAPEQPSMQRQGMQMGPSSSMTGQRMMMPGGMMRGGMTGEQMQDVRTIRGLLASHDQVERRVEDLSDGVRTITRSDDPRVAELIRTHVRQMHERYERDQPIRTMDPLFRELFERRHEATLSFEVIPGGIEVVHTSPNPEVVQLIRQHAHHFVNGVVDKGMAGAMGRTPLPEGYSRN